MRDSEHEILVYLEDDSAADGMIRNQISDNENVQQKVCYSHEMAVSTLGRSAIFMMT